MTKNTLPILLGVGVIAIALFMTFRQDGKPTTPQSAGKGSTPDVTATGSPSTIAVSPTSQPIVSGITLNITSPSGNTTVSNASLTVRGKTVPNAEVFINDSEVRADASGVFSVTLTLDEGENYILVVANDDIGNYSEKDLYITYTP